MPQRKCAAKRLRVDETRALHNLKLKSELKKELKGLRNLIAQGKASEGRPKSKHVFALLDRAAAKGLIHKNTASRRKSKLAIQLNKKA